MLVINSEASDSRLLRWSQTAAQTLPHGSHRALPGEWHGVPADLLAPALTEFLKPA
ncbi:MAG: hypothetical protein ACRDTM_08160 [Micromonosporaceae bacterium]